MKQAKALIISYLTKASYSSLNGGDKEADNIVSIKKIKANDGKEYPYCSSQAIRHALREQLAVLGYELSAAEQGKQDKGASTTKCDPKNYIDDDLFGYMNADKQTNKRTSPVRVSPAISLSPYLGDMDFAANFMGIKVGGNPNLFESEIHRGYYYGSILVELDRVGVSSSGDIVQFSLPNEDRINRVCALIDAIQNLWTVGRQSRFLTDMSPKFICSAVMKTKNPIFLEALKIDETTDTVNYELIKNTISDFQSQIIDYVIGERKGFFGNDNSEILPLGEAFTKIKYWVNEVYR